MTRRNRLIALLVSFVMIFSMFAVCVSAATEAGTQAATEAGTTASTEKATEKTTEKATEEDHSGHDHDGDGIPDDQEKISKGELITNIVVLGIIVIVAVVLIIKFRVKLAAFLRSVKSEIKKIVWASGSDTRKNFLVVIVIAVAVAAIIGILDFAFSEGIAGIVKLLQK